MAPQRGGHLNAFGVDTVQRLTHGIEGVDLDHHVNDAGIALMHRRADRQAVVAFVDAKEPHSDRAELGRQRDPECAAGTEAQHVGVEVEQCVGVGGRHHDMAQPLTAGDEFRAERGDHRAVVQHRPVEHLQCGTGGVLERDRLLDPARVYLVGGQLLERHSGPVKGSLDPLQRGAVADLPADVDHSVGLARHHDDPGRAFVHAQIQRRRVGSLPFGEAQDAEGELPPAVDISSRNGYVAKAFQVTHDAYS